MKKLMISTLTADNSFPIELTLEEPIYYDGSRRVKKIETLDGGSTFIQSGITASDRKIVPVFKITDALETSLRSAQETYNVLIFAFEEGVFKGTMQTLQIMNNGKARMTVLLQEKMSA